MHGYAHVGHKSLDHQNIKASHLKPSHGMTTFTFDVIRSSQQCGILQYLTGI